MRHSSWGLTIKLEGEVINDKPDISQVNFYLFNFTLWKRLLVWQNPAVAIDARSFVDSMGRVQFANGQSPPKQSA